jgi:hypothetical protein
MNEISMMNEISIQTFPPKCFEKSKLLLSIILPKRSIIAIAQLSRHWHCEVGYHLNSLNLKWDCPRKEYLI